MSQMIWSQENNSKYFEKLNSLIERGLYDDAQKYMDEHPKVFKNSNNTEEFIYSELFEILIKNYKADFSLGNYNDILSSISNSKNEYERGLRYFISAKALQSVLSNKSYEMYSKPEFVETEDINEWGTMNYLQSIIALYDSAFKYADVLQKVPIESFKLFITEHKNYSEIYTSIFDFMALDYFSFVESHHDRLLQDINKASAFSAKYFIPKTVVKDEKLPRAYQIAAEIFEKIQNAYSEKNLVNSLLHWDLKKVSFYYSINNDKKLLMQSYNDIASAYSNAKDAQLPFLKYIFDEFMMYGIQDKKTSFPIKTSDGLYTFNNKKELANFINTIAKEEPNTLSGALAISILEILYDKHLNLHIPEVIIPHQNVPILLSYKNISKVKFQIFKIDYFKFHTSKKNQNTAIINDPVYSYEYDLVNGDDMDLHTLEIPLTHHGKGLPAGQYTVSLEYIKDNGKVESMHDGIVFQVSNMAVLKRMEKNNYNVNYLILDRTSGAGLIPEMVELYDIHSKYENDGVYFNFKLNNSLHPNSYDINLSSSVNKNNDNSKLILIKNGGDELYSTEYIYNHDNYRTSSNINIKDIIILDRAVYRPGQTVQAKVISYESNSSAMNDYVVSANREVTLYLRDANGSVIDSVEARTNKWGSASVNFQLPINLLNGQFSITTTYDNYAGFKVEEYKRPTYFISMDTPSDSYKVGDKIQVTGKAEAYAGYGIDGAKVSYKIFRHVHFPYSWRCYLWPPINSSKILLQSGETKSHADGTISVPLQLSADGSIDKSLAPIFNYSIELTVTDVTGETKLSTVHLSAGYDSEFISISANDVINNNDDSVIVTVHNINNKPIDKLVNVSIYKLVDKEEKRKRLWEAPSDKMFSKVEFEKIFPHDEYESNSSLFEREKSKLIFQKNNVSSQEAKWATKEISLNQNGYYLIEADFIANDGQRKVEKQVIHVYKEKNSAHSQKDVLILSNKNAFQPGEKMILDFVTPHSNPYIISALSSFSGEKLFFDKNNIQHKVLKTDQGGMMVNCIYLKNNRIFEEKKFISIPFDDKALEIKWLSHTDKNIPGKNETWTYEVKGDKPENVEMLALLYDASLDEIMKHPFLNQLNVYSTFYSHNVFQRLLMGLSVASFQPNSDFKMVSNYSQEFPRLNHQFFYGGRTFSFTGSPSLRYRDAMADMAPAPSSINMKNMGNANNIMLKEESDNMPISKDIDDKKAEENNNENSNPRKNFNETAFFIPLKLSENGQFNFDFQFPESVTKWNMIAIAHTPDMKIGKIEGSVITQKDVMIQPNVPRFLKLNDKIILSAKIVNLTSDNMPAKGSIELFDPLTNEIITEKWLKTNAVIDVNLPAQQSQSVSWSVVVPNNYKSVLGIRYVADTRHHKDAVEYTIPILSDRKMLTEAFPLFINGSGSQDVNISFQSTTLTPNRLVLEYSAHPLWYVIQSMPQLMNLEPYSSDAIAQKYVLTALALKIAKDNPDIVSKIKTMATTGDDTTVISKLKANQELKSILLEETPWVLESNNMEVQLSSLISTFDEKQLNIQLTALSRELFKRQNADGGWPWMDKMASNDYVTASVLAQLAKIQEWNIDDVKASPYVAGIESALKYMENHVSKTLNEYWSSKSHKPYIITSLIHIIYNRLYWSSIFPVNSEFKSLISKYFTEVSQLTFKESTYQKAQLALIAHYLDKEEVGLQLIESLKQSAIVNDEMGMYWPQHQHAYYWYYNTFEAHYWAIKAFKMYEKYPNEVNLMKKWVLKQKQTQHWDQIRDAVMALDVLVLSEKNVFSQLPILTAQYNNQLIDFSNTASYKNWNYVNQTIDSGQQIPSTMKIHVDIKNPNDDAPTWGAVYWQYEEQIDKIKSNPNTPFKIKKTYLIQENVNGLTSWKPLGTDVRLKVGDIVKVMMTIELDRDIEFIHVKDYRPAAFEPISQNSGYNFKSGFGYYLNIKDASVDLFFDYMRKGTHTFDIEYKVESKGTFQSGITEIESYYAPEFRNVAPSQIISINE